MRRASASLLAQVREWIAEAKLKSPGSLSANGDGVMIYGDIGGAAYIHSDGRIEVEPADAVPGNVWREDPGVLTAILVAAAKRRPALAELLPVKPIDANGCGVCEGTGWVRVAGLTTVCGACHGLGWLSPPDTSLERTPER
jgi:hypothetical protein